LAAGLFFHIGFNWVVLVAFNRRRRQPLISSYAPARLLAMGCNPTMPLLVLVLKALEVSASISSGNPAGNAERCCRREAVNANETVKRRTCR